MKRPLSPRGVHLLVDAWEIDAARLQDEEGMRAAMLTAVEAAGASLVDLCVHRFRPGGLTAVATLAESHLAIHTWPEDGYLAADLYFCGAGSPRQAVDALLASLAPGQVRIRRIRRGPGARRVDRDTALAAAGDGAPARRAGTPVLSAVRGRGELRGSGDRGRGND